MALDTRGLASGFAQGFGLADTYYTRQEQGDRAERDLQMREEAFEMQKGQAQQEQNKETAKFVFGKIANNMELADEEMQWLKDNPNYLAALNPETDKALEVAQRVIDPQDEMDLNSEEGLYAINTMFEPMINRGKGGKKRIAAGLPGRTEGTMAFDLDVEREDGNRENAPMTRNRGVAGEDDDVLEVPVENLVNTAQGYRMLRNVINTNGASENAAKLYSLLTGKTPERSEAYTKRQEMLGLGVDPDEATSNAYGLDQQKNEQYGDAFEHPQLGWVQPGPNGELKQMDTSESESNADWRKLDDGRLYNQRTGEFKSAGGLSGVPNDGTGGLDSSVMSQIQQTSRNFHGSFNPDGSFLGIPDGARESYTEAMQRAQQLVQEGVPVFEATNIANLSVKETLSKPEAKRLAEQEAEMEITGWFKGDEKEQFVKRRTQELMDESKSAQQRYERIVSGRKGSSQAPEIDMQKASQIKADYKAGKITKEQAVSKLRDLGAQ